MIFDKDKRATKPVEQSTGPEFYDQSASVVSAPEGQRELTPWGDGSQASSIPYRGFEQHGVPYQPEPFMPHDIATMGNNVTPVYAEVLGQPIPVTIVDYPDPLGVSKTFQTTAYDMTAGQSLRLASKRPDRNMLKINVTVGAVAIAPTENHARSGLGFVIEAADGISEYPINDEVWVYAANVATVSAIELFTVANGGTNG